MSTIINFYSQPLASSLGDGRNRSDLKPLAMRVLPILLAGAAFWLFLLRGNDAQAQPAACFVTVYSFTNGADGGSPYCRLILSNSTLYGTASGGGTGGSGIVFAVNTDGTDFKTLHSFGKLVSEIPNDPFSPETNSDGSAPQGGLVLSSNTLYGTTTVGGADAAGTLFAVNTDATDFRLLHTFDNSDGNRPSFGLTLSGNRLYGAADVGGATGNGSVFTLNPDGTGFTTLHFFTGTDGGQPTGFVLSDNELYGETGIGGANDEGTVFAINTNGTSFTTLYAFSAFSVSPPANNDGAVPWGGLVLGGNTLYGTTEGGGTNGWGTVFAVNTDGTQFRLVHTFSDEIDGAIPAAGLVVSGNTLYGTASGGGTNHGGTVFAVNTDGTGFTVLHAFNGSDGSSPLDSLLLSGNTLYGTTVGGGPDDAGTIFAITLPSIPAIDPNSMAVSSGQLQFVVDGLTPGATVYVQASSDLSSAANWAPVATNVTTGTSLTISGLSVTNANSRYFRVLETSPP
jgi:uncharacterized repeat protein (TIGR03803 family)